MAAPRCPNLAHAGSTASRADWQDLFEDDRARGRLVAGCDEAGRACFAGPLVAAAVLFDYDGLDQDLLAGLNDSKKLTPARREALYIRVLDCAARVAVVLRASRLIDAHGLHCMNLVACGPRRGHVLGGFRVRVRGTPAARPWSTSSSQNRTRGLPKA